jgi:hypothetical protein
VHDGNEYMYSQRYVYIKVSPDEIQTPANRFKHHPPQHDRPAACVIAQQYSSATFVSLRSHPRREKFGSFLKNSTILIFINVFQGA